MNLNDLFTEEKVRLDPKCWTGKKIGNPKTKMKGGTRVNNCVPAESVEEDLTRRGFLKGAGAAAVAGAGGSADAEWVNRGTKKDDFDDSEYGGFDNESTDGTATLMLGNQRHGGQQNWNSYLHIRSNTGSWRPFKPAGHKGPVSGMWGRIRLDDNPVSNVHLSYSEGNNWTMLTVVPESGSASDRNFIQSVAAANRVRIELPARRGDEFAKEILEFKKEKNNYDNVTQNPVIKSAIESGKFPRSVYDQAKKAGYNDNEIAEYIKKTFKESAEQGVAEGLTEMDKSQTPPGRDGSNDSDAGKKEYTAKPTTAKKVAKDAEKILNKELNKKQGVAETMATFSAKASTRNSGSGEFRGVSIPSDMKHPEWREPTWSFQEIAQKLGIPVATLNLLAFNRIGGFPEALSGLSARHGSKKYYKQSEVKRWVNANNVREKLKQGVAEDQLNEKSVSQAQFRTMAAAAHNPEFAKKVGISQNVAKEFHSADKNSNYKKLPDRTTEGEQQKGADYRDPPEADYGDDYQDMVARVKKLAGLGPLKTVYDPAKRVYRNVPTAVQPKK